MTEVDNFDGVPKIEKHFWLNILHSLPVFLPNFLEHYIMPIIFLIKISINMSK